jgi:xanthine dehydrogenase iron-sulfur cluster and FAD-binding subunit A
MWQEYLTVNSIEDALLALAARPGTSRLVAGGTDLILELERGVRPGVENLVDISRIPGLNRILLDENDVIHLGPLVTHNDCAASRLIVECAFPLAQAAWEVGAPQIRNRGTVAGNLVTASPANDTIPPLMALGASVRLASLRGFRMVPLAEFYLGVRKTALQPDEMLVDINFPALRKEQRGAFIRIGLRRAQAISVVNAAVVADFVSDVSKAGASGEVLAAAITLGAVAPTIIRASEAETYLRGKSLTEAVIARAAELAEQAARPIRDLRSSAGYRSEMVRVGVRRILSALASGRERDGFPHQPILLQGKDRIGTVPSQTRPGVYKTGDPILTRINGKDYRFTTGSEKTLLRLLREEAGLTGTKEGCAEGECGACTVFLDGMAVMSCLVPAGRAHGAEIITIEGLAQDGVLHPVQQAFIDTGAVQCGYCTPGLIMSGAKLLEEQARPETSEIQAAISGNLCRCTGYYSIVRAIELAASRA